MEAPFEIDSRCSVFIINIVPYPFFQLIGFLQLIPDFCQCVISTKRLKYFNMDDHNKRLDFCSVGHAPFVFIVVDTPDGVDSRREC